MIRKTKKQSSKIPHKRVRKRVVHRDWKSIGMRLFFWCVVMAYSGVCGWVFLMWDGARITHVKVTGTDRMVAQDVEAHVVTAMDGMVWTWFPRAQYVFVRPDKIAQHVRAMSGIVRDVHVTKHFPDTISIAIEEWHVVYLWCIRGNSDQCALLTEDGQLGRGVAQDDAILRDNPVVRIYDLSGRDMITEMQIPTITPAFIADTVRRFEQIGVPLVADSFDVPHRRARELIVTTREGWVVQIATDRAIDDTVTAVASVLAHALTPQERAQLAAIDVRLGRKVFYRTLTEEGESEEENVSVQEVAPLDE